MNYNYCPKCKTDMAIGEMEYNYCQSNSCDFIQYNNPTPVVAAIVEYGEKKVVLGHNKAWPAGWYGLITGFLEKYEHPEECVIREVKEELGLDTVLKSFIGHYSFKRMNQIIIAYHVKAAEDTIILDDELDDYQIISFEKVQYWPAGTGFALRDFLKNLGYNPIERPFK